MDKHLRLNKHLRHRDLRQWRAAVAVPRAAAAIGGAAGEGLGDVHPGARYVAGDCEFGVIDVAALGGDEAEVDC